MENKNKKLNKTGEITVSFYDDGVELNINNISGREMFLAIASIADSIGEDIDENWVSVLQMTPAILAYSEEECDEGLYEEGVIN